MQKTALRGWRSPFPSCEEYLMKIWRDKGQFHKILKYISQRWVRLKWGFSFKIGQTSSAGYHRTKITNWVETTPSVAQYGLKLKLCFGLEGQYVYML